MDDNKKINYFRIQTFTNFQIYTFNAHSFVKQSTKSHLEHPQDPFILIRTRLKRIPNCLAHVYFAHLGTQSRTTKYQKHTLHNLYSMELVFIWRIIGKMRGAMLTDPCGNWTFYLHQKPISAPLDLVIIRIKKITFFYFRSIKLSNLVSKVFQGEKFVNLTQSTPTRFRLRHY